MGREDKGISKEARDHLHSKLDRMKGRERDKTIKRLREFDRGNVKKREEEWDKG